MTGCVLKVYGESFDVSSYLEGVSLVATQVFRAEDLPKRGEVGTDAGFHCVVSDRAETDFEGQVEEAVQFLRLHRADLTHLRAFAVRDAFLDFALGERHDVAIQRETLPVELLRECSDLGLEIVLTMMCNLGDG